MTLPEKLLSWPKAPVTELYIGEGENAIGFDFVNPVAVAELSTGFILLLELSLF